MIGLSEIHAARRSVARLTTAVQAAAKNPNGIGTRESAEIAAALDALHRETEAARDSGIELARTVGASWSLLQELTDTADSTLHARLRRFRRSRKKG